MKILQLNAENVKRLSVVEITPEGSVVEIAGKNGNGKTSVLDSIYWALGGAAGIQAQPIRTGAKSAKIKLQLGEDRTVSLIVERRFTESGTSLKVTTPDGASYQKPQQMLDDLLGALTFDPLQFMKSTPAQQFEILKNVVNLEVDIDALAVERKKLFDQRAEVNRTIKSLTGTLETLPRVDPTNRIDTSGIIDRLSKVDEHNSEVRQARAQIEAKKKDVAVISSQLETAKEHVRKLTKQLTEAESALADMEDAPIADLIDPNKIKQDLEGANETNRQAAAYEKRKGVEDRLAEEVKAAEDFTNLMETIDERRRAAISKAEMPIKELSLGDGIVTFDGVPIEQASDAAQLKVSAKIAALLNPKLRVIRIRDGSLLDDDAMKWLAEFAQSEDLQIWIERVGDGGPGAIVLEDGHIKGAAPVLESAE